MKVLVAPDGSVTVTLTVAGLPTWSNWAWPSQLVHDTSVDAVGVQSHEPLIRVSAPLPVTTIELSSDTPDTWTRNRVDRGSWLTTVTSMTTPEVVGGGVVVGGVVGGRVVGVVVGVVVGFGRVEGDVVGGRVGVTVGVTVGNTGGGLVRLTGGTVVTGGRLLGRAGGTVGGVTAGVGAGACVVDGAGVTTRGGWSATGAARGT